MHVFCLFLLLTFLALGEFFGEGRLFSFNVGLIGSGELMLEVKDILGQRASACVST